MLWEVSQTSESPPPPCQECIDRERIWLWLAHYGHRSINVAKLAKGVEYQSFMRIYSHLEKLVEGYSMAVPPEGIVLSFDRSSGLHEFAAWRERERRMSLAEERFANAKRLAALQADLSGMELTGENPRGCNTPEYVVTHEFGHNLWYQVDSAKYERWWRMEDMTAICIEAEHSAKEAFAEGFAMMMHTHRSEWPRAVQRLEEMLREDGVL